MTTSRRKGRTARTRTLDAIHEAMSDLYRTGLVDVATMREFDAMCLTPVQSLSPGEIRLLREREKVSQPVFAHYLNVTKGLVSKWERGEKKPNGPSLKLLNLVREKGLRAIA